MLWFSRFVPVLLGLMVMHMTAYAATPPATDNRLYDVVEAVSASRIEADIRTLAGFGTRHTLSDTVSDVHGIGAARRWIKAEFEAISETCGDCLEVSMQGGVIQAGENSRIPVDTEIINVIAIKRGSLYPDRYLIMCGDIDSRASDGTTAAGARSA